MGENDPKLGHFGPNWRHRPKFREIGQIFLFLKVFKIISVSGQKIVSLKNFTV